MAYELTLRCGDADQPGRVYLVGAGPGDPGLITVKGLDLLRAADVVLHDRLIPTALLLECRPAALIINVGKAPGRAGITQGEINALLVAHAQAGKCVVRLKGGDPFVFGRGYEEVDFCRRAGVACEVVPGVSSALAVPAAAGVPVTHRGISRSFAVITGRAEDCGPAELHDFAALAQIDTLCLLMGRAALREIADGLIAAGRDPAIPAAAIESGTTPAERQIVADLASIAEQADAAGLKPPVVTIIGPTAAFAEAANHAADLAAVVANAASERTIHR